VAYTNASFHVATIPMAPLLRVTLLFALSLLATAQAWAQEPLFTVVQISDSQADSAADQQRFELVLDTIVAGGQNGALLPRRADLVIFPGDLVWSDRVSHWDTFLQTMDSRLTANGIPYFAVPGNHDNSDFDFSLYDQFIASPDPWDFGSSSFTGHNGIGGSTGWRGLRFVGFNNSNGGDNQVSAQDLADVESRVAAAAAAGENVFLVGHYAHDHGGPIPLIDVLETPEVRGYMRGHAGTTAANHGLDGTSNGDAWELNSQSIFEDGALIYCEVFETEIDVYVLTLVDGPTQLPPADTISLAHALTPTAVGPPTADFDAAPDVGPAPLSVAFTDLSTGPPSSWLWEFGDGATSGLQHPVHTYTEAGVYSVTLTVTNGGGSDSVTRADLISVGAPPPNVAFQPIADAKVRSSSADANYGLDDGLRIKDSSTIYDSYLQFDVTGLGGGVASAVLRLYVTDGGADGGTLYEVDDGWTETGITWNNAPPIGGAPLGSAGEVSVGWIEFDVSAVVTGEGTYSFALTSDDGSSVYFSSREGANPPELLVESGDPVAPTADFGAAPRSGGTPLSVDFTDLSSGSPTSWEWAFGDGASSSAQHPSHVYTSAGTFTVSLTVTNAAGSDTTTRAGYVVVTAPLAPTADFDAAPTDGSAPLSVAFTDLSTGPPSTWLWEFGDGSTSGLQHPVHTYTEAGLYNVTLTVTNGAGSDSVTRADLISVAAPPPIVSLQPVADARVRSRAKRADTNYGLDDILSVKDGGSIHDSYLQFEVAGLGGAVVSAVLRLYVTDAGTDGGTLYEVDDGWTETGITWNNAPPIGGAPLGSVGAVSVGWVELDVSAVVTGDGTYSFALTGGGRNSVYYSSREGANPPELVLTTSP
jgi:PKD repeat protein